MKVLTHTASERFLYNLMRQELSARTPDYMLEVFANHYQTYAQEQGKTLSDVLDILVRFRRYLQDEDVFY